MSLLGDLLGEAAESVVGLGPSTPRGQLLLLSASGIAFTALNGWLLVTYANPLTDSDWSLGAIIGAILLGSLGVMLSGLHLTRDDEDKAVGMTALLLNVAAIGSAVACTL